MPMGSNGRKKTTMAKLARESKLRERRLVKAARRDARKDAAADGASGSGTSIADTPPGLRTDEAS